MSKDEFEDILMDTVSDEAWFLIEAVYNDHPACVDKMPTAELWRLGGRALFEDMRPRTDKLRELRFKREALLDEARHIENVIERIKFGGGFEL